MTSPARTAFFGLSNRVASLSNMRAGVNAVSGSDLYVGGGFTIIGGANRNALAFLPVADAPDRVDR